MPDGVTIAAVSEADNVTDEDLIRSEAVTACPLGVGCGGHPGITQSDHRSAGLTRYEPGNTGAIAVGNASAPKGVETTP
jgi:hypothetical protein